MCGKFLSEVIGEHGNVFAALAKRRQREGNDIEPVIEIAAKITALDHSGEGNVGGGDDPNIDMDGVRFSEPFDLALLKSAQEFGLQMQRHLSDFVQQNGAAIGELELSGLGAD